MIREALEYLSHLVTRSQEVEPFQVSGVSTKSLVRIGENVIEYAHEPQPREHQCQEIESFGQWCGEAASTIWYNMDSLHLILSDSDEELRRDGVSMRLSRSTEWQAAMDGIKDVSQSRFIRWILDHLDRNIETAAPGLLQTIRQLKFAVNEAGQGNVANGKESFGKSIEAEVAGGKEFPDDITVRVLVWAELDIHVDVRMAFIVNPHESTFTLRALPASKQQATRAALQELGGVLAEHQGDSKLFCGVA